MLLTHLIRKIMKNLIRNLLLSNLFLVIVFSSCESEKSSDVNQDRIYTRYSMIYEAGQDKTYAKARFRFGSSSGTLLELTAPSIITLNDVELEFMPLLAYYQKSFTGNIPEGTFYWKTTDGLELINTISLNEIDFPADLTEISSDISYELSWVGKVLEVNEYVSLSLNGDLEDDQSTITVSGIGTTSIIISKTNLQKLPKNQEANFALEFGETPPLTNATSAGGKIFGKYRISKKIMIR